MRVAKSMVVMVLGSFTVVGSLVRTSWAQGLAGPPSLAPCAVRGLADPVLCGTVRVPEDRARPNGRTIDLAVVVARATGLSREPDPFLLLAGGPGQAATDMGEFASAAFGRVRERRDLVLIDARGTGRSNGLRCALMRHPKDFGGWTIYPSASITQCRDSLSRTADLTQYTTAAIADDIEAVRTAFGWPALNFYGTSYGTRLALIFLRRHATSVRTMTLKAVAPPTLVAPMNYAADAERAFSLLERDCAADARCAAAFPSPRADLDTILARAASGRIRAPVTTPTGTATIAFSRDAVAGALLGAMQSASARSRLPAMLHQAAAGDLSVVAALVIAYRRALDGEFYLGMHLSVSCTDDGRRLDPRKAARDDAGTMLGASRVRMLFEACREWPRGPAEPSAAAAVTSKVPVLLVSGELDPNTPPRHAEAALRSLSKGRHVVLHGVAHGWSNVGACGGEIVASFVTRGSADDVDASCGARSSAPAFVIPERR